MYVAQTQSLFDVVTQLEFLLEPLLKQGMPYTANALLDSCSDSGGNAQTSARTDFDEVVGDNDFEQPAQNGVIFHIICK